MMDQYEKKMSVETKLRSSAATLMKVHTDPKSKVAAQEEFQGILT
jgi:hypothetical protein